MENVKIGLSMLQQLDTMKLTEENYFFDYSDKEIKSRVFSLTSNLDSLTDKAVRIFNFVRDNIKYSMYVPFYPQNVYKASNILKSKKGFCIQKAVLLVAMLRCAGIPSVLGFADIVNHAVPKEAFEFLGTKMFAYHGFALVKTENGWIKATPTFDIETCQRAGYPVVNFDGKNDAVFPLYRENGEKFIEYVKYHGFYLTVPVEDILEKWKEVYGKERVNLWIGKTNG